MLVAIIIDLPFSRFMWKMWVTTSLCVDFSSSWSTIFEILNGNYEPLNDHYEPLHRYIQQIFFPSDLQKQPSRGVLVKRCSKNMQQIYKTTSMPKCDFNKVAKQLYWNRTLAWVFSCKFASYFQNSFSEEHLWVWLLLSNTLRESMYMLIAFVNQIYVNSFRNPLNYLRNCDLAIPKALAVFLMWPLSTR